MAGQSRLLIIGASVAIGIVASGVGIWLARREKIPNQWRKVGEICDLMCYPIKSCAPIRESDMNCENIGLAKGEFTRDRIFMICDLDGNFITGRQYPKMVLIQPEIDESKMILTLKAPGMMDATVDLEKLLKQSTKNGTVWGDHVKALDCGEESARWLSRFIISDDVGLRLLYYPYKKPRTWRNKLSTFPKHFNKDAGAFQDSTSFMLLPESSVADLNSRLEKIVPAQQFRPNFVVKGTVAYEEDDWDYVKIGNETIFRNVRPCTRCIFTTIDPETGIKDSSSEPLKTLRTYRQLPDPELAKKERYSPVMGIHLGLRHSGVVKVGDPVYVSVSN